MKKIISIMLVIFILMSSLIVSAEINFYEDYAEKTDSLSMLRSLELLPDKQFEAHSVTTRAEFCAMLAKAVGLYKSGGTVYKDVPLDHWASQSINSIVSLGLLKGVGNGYFFPDEPVKTSDIINAISKIVYQGEYFKGLLTLKRLGVIERLNTTKDYFTNEETATLILQMLENPSYQVQTIFPGNTQMKLTEEPMFTFVHNIYEREGILDSIICKGEKNYAMLDGVAYEYSSELAYIKFFLSKNVIVYTCEDESGRRILYVKENDKKSETTKLLSENVNFINGEVNYYDGKKERSLQISKNPLIYINGELQTQYIWKDLNHTSGWTEFVDCDDDGIIDSILQYRSVTSLVTMVNSGKKLIDDFYQINSLDLSKDGVSYSIFDKNGSVLSLSDIEKWDVLSIFKNSTGKDIIIIRSGERISGMVDGIGEDLCSIDGVEYDVDKEYLNSERYELAVGMKGTFYLNAFGKIVAARFEGNDMDYGILLAVDEGKGLSDILFVKLFTQNGKIEIIDSAEKLRINGNKESAKTASNILKTNALYQLVRYKLNDEDVITDIELAKPPQKGEVPYDTSCFTLNYKGSSKIYYDIIGPGYKADAETQVFVIPSDRSDESSYQIGDKSLLPTDYTNVSFYDCGEDYYIHTAVVEYNSAKGASDNMYGQNMVVFKGLGKAVGRNGDVVPVVHYMQMGQKGSVIVKSDGLRSVDSRTWSEYAGKTLEDLKPGDLFQFTTDSFGEMNEFHVLYSSPYPANYIEKGTTTPTKDFMVGMLGTCYGKVLHKNSEAIIVNANGMGNSEIDYAWNRIYRIGGVSVTLVIQDKNETKIVKGGKEDILVGDSVFVRLTTGSAKDVIIYRKGV